MIFSHLMIYQDNLFTSSGEKYSPNSSYLLSCVQEGCHQIEEIDKSKQADRLIALDHIMHIKKMKEIGMISKCLPCHKDIAHGKEQILPSMKTTCFLCHSPRDTAASNCVLCHSTHADIKLKAKEKNLSELHQMAKISCTECHLDHCKATKAVCEKCHQGKGYGDLVCEP